MKNKLKNIILMCVACAMLTSCTGNKQGAGTGIGAVAGGLLGAQFGKGPGQLLFAGLGAVAGGLVGSSIGKNMDDTDKMMAEKTSQKALESAPAGRAVAWNNPGNGHSGTITPTKTYKQNDGGYCREYTQTVTVAGKQQQAYGKACRQQDGNWQIVQ